MSILAIIPARGGSKGLPGKNIRPLGGKPLLAYSIEAALNCRFVNRVVVSTENPHVAEVALRHGAEVPFLRRADLAGDKASLSQVVDDMLWRLAHSGQAVGAHITLLPTSPFRTPELMDHLCELLVHGHRTVQTVKSIQAKTMFLQDNGQLSPVRDCAPNDAHGPEFRSYGIFTGANPHGRFPAVMHPVSDPVMLIDIDRPEDFELAEAVLFSQTARFRTNGEHHE